MAQLFRNEASALGATREIDAVFAELWNAYSETSRHYHSLAHVGECLAWLDQVRASLSSPAEVALAIWFHDAIYATYPHAGSEAKSADLAQASCLRMGIPQASAQRIATLVRATQHHGLEPGAGVDKHDALTFFDIDLAIFGSDPLRYAEYERDVRAEYSWVPEGTFRTRRAALLREFLDRPRIYHHDVLYERLETKARRNIERAISELTAPFDDLQLHATDEHVVVTRAAALVEVHPWSELETAAAVPSPAGSSARLSLAFEPDPAEDRTVAFDAPYADEVVERVRSIPGYDREAERRGTTGRKPAIVYARTRELPGAAESSRGR